MPSTQLRSSLATGTFIVSQAFLYHLPESLPGLSCRKGWHPWPVESLTSEKPLWLKTGLTWLFLSPNSWRMCLLKLSGWPFLLTVSQPATLASHPCGTEA